ncbi:MAG: maleylacetoacetate isomerase [Xanthomonadales bacterium]|nr:maleylacetoacetate isomerase [Xanthomonadales bacterium]
MTADPGLTLYDYWRSSAAWRVRIGLRLKGLDYTSLPVHLVRDGGEQHQPGYRQLNPAGLVPSLRHDGQVLTQSLAILEYLDEAFPETHRLLPADPAGRARVRALALAIAADTHPLHNLRVQQYLKGPGGMSEDAVAAYVRHWLETGFATLEALLAGDDRTGRCSHGDQPGLADCVLVPAVYAARRFGADLDACTGVLRIHQHCAHLPAFIAAQPDRQPDAPTA